MRDADANAATVVGEIVNSVRNGLAQFLVLKVVAVDPARLAFAAPVCAGVPVVTDQLFLLRIDRDHRLIVGLEGQDLGIDVLELGITVRMVAALMCSNWASRSGWLRPSLALKLPWRLKPRRRSRRPTVSAET